MTENTKSKAAKLPDLPNDLVDYLYFHRGADRIKPLLDGVPFKDGIPAPDNPPEQQELAA